MVGTLSLLFACLYLSLSLWVRCLARRPWARGEPADPPLVSIIIAGRNEAEELPGCLDSLMRLRYPAEKLEILLVDDASHDGTLALLQAFAEGKEHVTVLALERQAKELSGKAGAVLQAIEKSNGEYIFITDADCRVPSLWIETHLAYFTAEVGMVGGLTLLHRRHVHTSWLDRVQSLDWLFLQLISSACAHAGKPLSWMGNNMAFRRSAYDAVGGYRQLNYSLIEDFSLLNAISRKTSWRVVLHTNQAAIVQSRPEKTLQQLYQQRRRWALGIQPVRPLGKMLMAITYCIRMLVWLCAALLHPAGWIALAAIVLGDGLILSSRPVLSARELFRSAPGFEVFYFLFVLLMPPALWLDKTIIWKDDVYAY